MNIVITMAGLGSRFTKVGYNCPKYMIEAKGKTLFEWSMMSLLDYFPITNKIVFVTRVEHNSREFINEQCRKFGLKDVEIIELNYLTDGQATTAKIGIDKCDKNDSLMIYNIDTYIEPYNLLTKDLKGDGHIPCFHAEGDHWSFVKEENGKVTDVVEKVRISNNCSLGAYYFKKAQTFLDIYDEFYSGTSLTKEKYIAPMYKIMLDKGMEITYSIIKKEAVHVLGTPEELQEFIENN